jgi:hypothetical protein
MYIRVHLLCSIFAIFLVVSSLNLEKIRRFGEISLPSLRPNSAKQKKNAETSVFLWSTRRYNPQRRQTYSSVSPLLKPQLRQNKVTLFLNDVEAWSWGCMPTYFRTLMEVNVTTGPIYWQSDKSNLRSWFGSATLFCNGSSISTCPKQTIICLSFAVPTFELE